MIFRRRNARRTLERALPLTQAQELVHAPIERAQELVHTPLERAQELIQGPIERAQSLVHAPVERAQEIAQGVLPRRRRRSRGRALLLLALPAAVIAAMFVYKKLTERKEPAEGSEGSHTAAPAWQTQPPPPASPTEEAAAPSLQGGQQQASPPPAEGPAVLEGRAQQGMTEGDFLGRKVIDVDGNQIGEVEAVYNRGEGHPPEWAALRTGAINPRRILVPLEDARVEQGEVLVPYTQELVRDAPAVEGDSVEPELEQRLYSHYNLRRVTDADAATLTTGMGPLRIMSAGRS